jgi:hypothetical protein
MNKKKFDEYIKELLTHIDKIYKKKKTMILLDNSGVHKEFI